MNHKTHKIGFWSVFALVTASQLGSSIFILPASLAPYGLISIAGGIIAGLGAVALALVFAKLCSWFPKTGGPHVYVKEAFGTSVAFFCGWTYWLISWISSTVVIIASIGYLTPLLGSSSPLKLVILEVGLLAAITTLNLRGVGTAGRVEFFLTILKSIPLVVVPLVALYYFTFDNFMLAPHATELSLGHILSRVTFLALWGFVGLESATTPAESVENPSKTIPKAVVAGTACVAFLYILNSLSIMGAIPGSILMLSNAPHAETIRIILGGNWHLFISVIGSIVCIGTLNAWTLTSGQIALGLAQDNLMPRGIAKTNKYGAPFVALAISALGTTPLLIMTSHQSMAEQILTIIDFSVTAFLFVYALCCFAFFKVLLQKRTVSFSTIAYGCAALFFCCWVIMQTPLNTLFIASLFTISGVPVYWWLRTKKMV